MYIPPGYTEAEVLAIIERVALHHAPSYTFGSYERDDIAQEARIICLKALDVRQYDPARPLENYLHVCVQKRLLNLFRDECHRNDPPCRGCHGGDHCQDSDGSWKGRNDSKASLAKAADPDDDRPSKVAEEPDLAGEADLSELLALIDRELPIGLRPDYLRMRANEPIPKARRRKVEDAVRLILEPYDQAPP
jgi:DNA-directed RNA polymerase specialized sigma24 family protein